MPNQTFLNLERKKQEKLLEAAINEFSCRAYSDVSINQIIINAGISRGSFYMYFQDKADLFEYLIDISKVKLHFVSRKVFLKNSGDLYKSFLELYDVLVDFIIKNRFEVMFKNIFIYFCKHFQQFEKPGYLLYLKVRDLIDTGALKDNDDDETIFIMLLHNLFMSITYGIDNNCLSDKKHYLRKLHILCYGIYKNSNERV